MKVHSIESGAIPFRQPAKTLASQEGRDAGLEGVKDRAAVQAEQAAEETQDGLNREVLEEAVDKANKTMETYNTELRFSIHEASGEIMVKVVNTKDNTVIREIPPERVLDFVAHVKKMLGIIIDKFI